MRIESLWIENFRSIRRLRMEGLGAYVVLYGENGAGKSNILAALQALFRGFASWTPGDAGVDAGLGRWDEPVGGGSPFAGWALGGATVGARLVATEAAPGSGLAQPSVLTLQLVHTREGTSVDQALCTAHGQTIDLRAARPTDEQGAYVYDLGWGEVEHLAHTFAVVPATRALGREPSEPPGPAQAPQARIASLLARGRLKHALVEAQTSPDLAVRTGVDTLRDLLAGPPLHRPRFDPVYDPASQTYELAEVRRSAAGGWQSLPVDLAGLGLQQVYSVLAGLLVTGATIGAVEEPEAHLHPRTTGRQLRALLQRVVAEGPVDQLFVATHSNLFDLDPDGYWIVRNDPSVGTVAERTADFSRLDREVFWEPGPARGALLTSLRDLPTDTVVFRTAGGAPVTAADMLRRLQEDDEVALSFVDDVQSLAVGTVRRLAKRGSTS